MPPRLDRVRSDFALTPALRADARAAFRLLEGSGLTLEQAARRAIEGSRAVQRITVEAGVDSYLRHLLVQKIRARSVTFHEQHLNRFVRRFGDSVLDDISRAEFRAWINGMTSKDGKKPMSEATKASYVRSVKAFWSWAVSIEPPAASATRCPAEGMATSTPPSRAGAEFFTVEECAAILKSAGAYRSALAFLLFTGVRPEELAGPGKPRLTWRSVNAAEKIIRIPEECSKTGRARIIEELPEALWAWITPGKDEEPICSSYTRQILRISRSSIKRKWPRDGTRHSFGTYALAHTSNPGQVSMWMGHEGNPTMLNRHYRGLATKAEAKAFWALRP